MECSECGFAMQCSECGLSGGDIAGGVHTGLDASEMIVRGGRLSEPLMFSNLVVGSDGKRFLRLKKTHDGLCRFLTGKGSYTCPLASTMVFETLRARRDEQVQDLARSSFDGPPGIVPDEEKGEDDPMAPAVAVFELAASGPVHRGPPRAIKRLRMSCLLQSSANITVGLESGLELVVLAEASHLAPAIEVTASSLWSLLRLVNRDLESIAKPSRRAKVRVQEGDGREPRGPRGPFRKREYWDQTKHRWVQKELQSDGSYRVLTRKATPPGDGDLESLRGPLLALPPSLTHVPI